MRVSNLTSPRSGQPVANQFTVTDGDIEYFQSYETVIAKREGGAYTISSYHNYSSTTSKYFAQWLRRWDFTDTEVKSLKRWLSNAKSGDELVELVSRRVNIKLVGEL